MSVSVIDAGAWENYLLFYDNISHYSLSIPDRVLVALAVQSRTGRITPHGPG